MTNIILALILMVLAIGVGKLFQQGNKMVFQHIGVPIILLSAVTVSFIVIIVDVLTFLIKLFN